MFSETHAAQRDMLIRDIIAKMRHDGCGGRAGRVELLTGFAGASSRPVRKIVRKPPWVISGRALIVARSAPAPGANGHRDCRRPARKGATDVVLAAPAEFQRKENRDSAAPCDPIRATPIIGRYLPPLTAPYRARARHRSTSPAPAHAAAPRYNSRISRRSSAPASRLRFPPRRWAPCGHAIGTTPQKCLPVKLFIAAKPKPLVWRPVEFDDVAIGRAIDHMLRPLSHEPVAHWIVVCSESLARSHR